jgi:hypothetical protein
MAILYQTNLTDKETCQMNKYIKKKITVGNWHIWKGQQLTGYGIFEFRFRKKIINLCVHRVKVYIHNGCRAIDTVQYMSHLFHNKLRVWIGFCPWKQLKLTRIDKFAKLMVNAHATIGLQNVFCRVSSDPIFLYIS